MNPRYILLFRKIALVIVIAVCFEACAKKTEDYGSITGYVTDANTGEPLRNVDVTLTPLGISTVSGGDGRYEFLDLDANQYTIQAAKSGYQTNTKVIQVRSGKVASGDIMLTPNYLDMSLSVSYVDFGTVGTVETFQIINESSNGSFQWSIVKEGAANWLTVSPVSGSIGAGQRTLISMTVDRTQVTTQQTIMLRVNNNTSGSSIALPVSVDYNSGNLQVTPNPVDFGATATSRQLTIHNNGLSTVTYLIDYSCLWLTMSPTSGTIGSGSSATINLSLNRAEVIGEAQTILHVRNNDDGSNIAVVVKASEYGGSGNEIVVSNGLQAYYTFDDGTANDFGDNGYDGTLVNGAVTVNDVGGGQYLKLNSSQGSYMCIPYNLFSRYTHWTVSFWIKDLTAGKIFAAQSGNTGNNYFAAPAFIAKQDGDLAFRMIGGSGTNYFNTIAYNYINTSDEWNHYVLTMDGTGSGNIKLYVNGTLKSTITAQYSSDAVNQCTQIYFGGPFYNLTNAGMKLDNIRIYGRTLYMTEIQMIYNNENKQQ